MATSFQNFAAGSLDDLMGHLLDLQNADGVIVSVENITSTAGGTTAYFHRVGYRPLKAWEASELVEILTFTSGVEDDQRLQIAETLTKGNEPVDYTSLTFSDKAGKFVATDVFFYRPDKGAWLATVSKPALITGNIAARIPWSSAKKSATSYRGLSREGLARFADASGQAVAVTAVTDADIDTDGPGGSNARDKYWQPHTSLRYVDGRSCDSRSFPGVVIPPGITQEFGVRIGDFAVLSYNDKEVPAQVYDSGPGAKIGEISFGAAVALGIYKDSSAATEASAATKGNNVNNLLTIFFPGSGSGRAVSIELIKEAVGLCLNKWLGGQPAAGIAPAAAAGAKAAGFPEFIASLKLKHVTLAHALGTTGTAPNALPDAQLWPNIAPTLIVVDAIADQLGQTLRVNSTYRNVAYNNVVGGAKRSQHIAFRAVDFSIEGTSPEEVAKVAKTMRGGKFAIPIANLQLTNNIPGLPTPPPLNLAALSLDSSSGSNTTFTYHGGIQDYDSFVHIDCRGDDVSWG